MTRIKAHQAEDLLPRLGLDQTETGRRIIAELDTLAGHQLYRELSDPDEIRRYMEYHVWCVWEFMSLAKSIQSRLGCYSVPWIPPADIEMMVAINEIIQDEEQDIGPDSERASHFEIYLQAMREVDACTDAIEQFIQALREETPIEEALAACNAPGPAREYVTWCMKLLEGPLPDAVATFCLGREVAVPMMFINLLHHLPKDNGFATFRWYLSRHIELDSEIHAPASVRLFKGIVGEQAGQLEQALGAAQAALQNRQRYLDAILEAILQGREAPPS